MDRLIIWKMNYNRGFGIIYGYQQKLDAKKRRAKAAEQRGEGGDDRALN